MSSTNQSLLHYEQGKLCYQNKKFQDAIFQFSEAIRLKPDNPQHMARCYNARGVVHFYLGEFGKVIKDCTRALQMDPQNANYYNCRGNAYFSLGKFDKAAGDFTMAIQLSPETSHGRYFNNRGSAYRRLKMFKEAIDDYTAAIAVDSKNGNYYNNRGNTYFDMGEFQLAIDDFTTALGLEPYSPKTKLTLAQAHEALAQEKRMKNITQFTGEFSHLKGDKKEKGKTHRKHRTCAIYVSPKGVEITYTKGWRKVKKTESFAWSEQMVIELVNENQLKLYLDTKGDSWLLITPCEATAVEEELIGRITTKFASYSTACLVAQHERVVNEYLNILKNIKEAESQRALFDMIAQEAEKQQDQFVKNEKFELAEKSKAQRVKMLEQINQKKEYIAQEMDRAEAVRQKAEQEAGPVLDMVLIMQNRVRELYHTRVKGVKDKYKVEDLELEEQLVKMENLVNRAKELGNMVAKPVEKAQEEDVNDFDEEEAEEANQYWKKDGQEGAAAPTSGEPEPAAAQPKEDAPAPKEEPAPAPAPAPEVVAIEKAFQAPQVSSHHVDAEHDTVIKEERKREREKEKKKMTASELLSDSEESDWDDIDENSLPESFMPSQGELFMSVDVHPGGMVTITPSRSSHDGVATVSDGKHKDEVVMVRKVSLDEYGAKIKEKEKEVMELSEKAKLADKVAAEKEDLEKHYNESIESLGKYQQEAETLRQALQKKMEEMTQTSGSLEQKLDLTVKEQQEAQNKLQQQAKDIEALRQHLNKVNSNLAATTAEAEARSNRMAELEMRTKEQEEELQKFKQITGEEKEKAARLRKEYEDQIKNMSSESQQLVADLEKTKKEKNQLAMQVEESVLSIAQLRKNLQTMEAQLRSANEEKKSQQQKLSEIAAKSQEDALVIQKMKEQAVLEEKKRRELHNLIQEIKGNIRVYIRIRPALKSKDGYQLFQEVPGSDDRGLEVVSPPEQSATGGGMKSKRWTFEFDRVFWPRHSQKDVFDEISQLVQSALDGYKVCIFAYGQTGSGKTFTMEGPEVITEESRGVIPRAVEQIFKHAKEMSEKGWKIDCAASFLEIYNTDIRDLLNTTDEDKTDLDIKLIKKGNNTIPTVSGLTVVPVASAADLNPLLKQASSKRATSATRSNDRSSRSHSVFQLRIHGVHAEQKVENEGILNLIDLAGSERVEKSEVVGARFEEAKAINSSLTCLGDVIAALANGAKHVPFRNSKLTYLLQDCFGGGSKTLMFINLAGELDNMQESISSLRFGSKVHECHIGSAKKDVKRSDDSKEAAPAAAPKKKK